MPGEKRKRTREYRKKGEKRQEKIKAAVRPL